LLSRKEEAMISTILVPTDGSKAAKKAGEVAIDLAKQLNATVIILSIVDRRALISIGETAVLEAVSEAEVEAKLKNAAEEYIKEMAKLCHESGVQLKALIGRGHPVEEIIREAQQANADLIVMGSHGRSALAATVLGSVAYGVIHRDFKVPVMVVKG
jgi:nucleotide-binding universal stress UspA family protein